MIPLDNTSTAQNYTFDSINLRDYIRSDLFSGTTTLSINSMNITNLPESVSEFEEIDALDITNTPITSLPDSIGDLRNLERIYLANTSIRSLPESIGRLPLTRLTISNAPISSLPDSIGNINNLFLSLTNTQITALPNTVRNLFTLLCDRDITVSPELSEYLESRSQISAAHGRQIRARNSRMPRRGTESVPSSFQSKIERLYSFTDRKSDIFNNIANISNINQWLDRILSMENTDILAPFLIEILEYAEKSFTFKERLTLSIEESLGACDDRISFYINHIYMEKKLFCIESTNSSELIKFLLQIAFPISLIDQIAAQKSMAIGVEQGQENYREEIETYLAYLTSLNSRLSLGLPIPTMLFERISKVQPKDIDTAETLIRSKMNKQEDYIPFLIEQPVWIRFLQSKYSKEINEIDEKAIEILDLDSENSGVLIDLAEKAKKFRNNYLALLTQNYLNNLA